MLLRLLALACLACSRAAAFSTPPHARVAARMRRTAAPARREAADAASAVAAASVLPRAAAVSALALAMAPLAASAAEPLYPWAGTAQLVLGPTLAFGEFMMLCRVVLSWYPEVNANKMPWNIVAWPTEPILKVTRSIVPPAFGVDISPIVWIAILSLLCVADRAPLAARLPRLSPPTLFHDAAASSFAASRACSA